MSFTILEFFLFLLLTLVVYYLLPKKFRWIWLLIVSLVYYVSFGVKKIVFVLWQTMVVYLATRLIDKQARQGKAYLASHKADMSSEEKKAYKAKLKKKKKITIFFMLLATFISLCGIKYTDFAILNVNILIEKLGRSLIIPTFNFVAPIGISFFTFQTASYVIDVYWGKVEVEKNPFKLMLFVCFFPQILEGPIGRFQTLGKQLFEGNDYNLKNIQFGLQRILFGLAKKLIIADRSAAYVNKVFANPAAYGGWYDILAVLLYCAELYADFSGGMDLVIGIAQMLGITMDENFRQPFFSKSIGEFWRRWHITLGTWMKDYIFYPFSLSKVAANIGKWSKKHFGEAGKKLPVCIADLIIFFIVGVWHGAAWKYIAYGMYNGLIMAVSVLLEPVYKKFFEVTHIKKKSAPWQFWMIIRTFILVNIGWYFDMSPTVRSAIFMMKDSFNFASNKISLLGIEKAGMSLKDLIIVAIACLVLLIISIFKERGVLIREKIASFHLPIRWFIYYALIAWVILFGYTNGTSAFMYANF